RCETVQPTKRARRRVEIRRKLRMTDDPRGVNDVASLQDVFSFILVTIKNRESFTIMGHGYNFGVVDNLYALLRLIVFERRDKFAEGEVCRVARRTLHRRHQG